MIPGEMILSKDTVEINAGREVKTVSVANAGDRPIQVGSHYHFFEVNPLLSFDRDDAFGMHLDIPSGTSVRFEPGETKTVVLVAFGGNRKFYGLNNICQGADTLETVGKDRLQKEAIK